MYVVHVGIGGRDVAVHHTRLPRAVNANNATIVRQSFVVH